MFVIMMAVTLLSSVCMSMALQTGTLTKGIGQGGFNAQIAITIGTSLGLALFFAASFMIEMYEYSDLDFWDYGEITAQGVIYLSAKILGALSVAENLIALAVLAVKDLKEKDTNA